jgi:hypothetical protein
LPHATLVRDPTVVATARRGRGPVPLLVSQAVVAAALGVLVVQTLVLVVWAIGGTAAVGAGEAVRGGLVAWVAAHHVPIELPAGMLGLTPLGLTLVLLLLTGRAGAAAQRALPSPAGLAALARGGLIGLPYGLVVATATGLARVGDVSVPPVRALLMGVAVGALGGAVGSLRAYGVVRAWEELPVPATVVVDATVAAVAALTLGGLLAFLTSLSWHAGRAADVATSLRPGFAGGVALALLCLLLLPNAAIWTTAYACATGVAVGVGTSVSMGGVEIGAVPALPLLAALPAAGPAPRASWLLVLVPLVAAVAAGVVVGRGDVATDPARAAAWALAVGCATGAVVLVLCELAGGALGPGRLATAGPNPWVTALAAAAWVGLGGAVTAFVVARRRLRAA